jgi:hypothetical protein
MLVGDYMSFLRFSEPNIQAKHKVFISYHHANDEYYRNRFELLFSDIHNIIISKSVQIGDIDPNLKTETVRQKIRDEYLRDSTVTIVLIGSETWKRKHVDWEISSSIRHTEYNPRSGLLGIILPTYPKPASDKFYIHTIPPRLYDNIKCRYASIYNWSENENLIQQWIDDAFVKRNTINPDNSFPSFSNNRSGERWQP